MTPPLALDALRRDVARAYKNQCIAEAAVLAAMQGQATLIYSPTKAAAQAMAERCRQVAERLSRQLGRAADLGLITCKSSEDEPLLGTPGAGEADG